MKSDLSNKSTLKTGNYQQFYNLLFQNFVIVYSASEIFNHVHKFDHNAFKKRLFSTVNNVDYSLMLKH